MNKEKFVTEVKKLLNINSSESIETWVDWAEECVDADQYVNFVRASKDKATSAWLESLYASFYFVKQKLGQDTAVKILELSSSQLCLYPYEIQAAAEKLQKGASREQILKVLEEGSLVDDKKPPTMKDVKRDISKKRDRER